VTELRVYLQRDSLRDGSNAAWALLDGAGRVARTGTNLREAPRVRPCRLVIEADRVAVLDADLPDVPARRLAALLGNALEPALLEEVEQIHVVPLGRDARGQALGGVISAPWLEGVLARLAELELHPESALPEGLLLPRREGHWSLLANEGSHVLRLDEVRAYAIDASDLPVGVSLALAREPVPAGLDLYQGSALRLPDVAAWQQAYGFEVRDAGRWDWRTAPWRTDIDLLGGRFASRRAGLDLGAALRPMLWGGLALILINLAALAVDTYLKQREAAALRAEQMRVARRVLPAGASVVDPAWQVGERWARLQGGVAGRDSPALGHMLAALGEAWPGQSGLRPSRVEYADGSLLLAFKGSQTAALASMLTAATAAGLAAHISEENGETRVRVQPAQEGTRP